MAEIEAAGPPAPGLRLSASVIALLRCPVCGSEIHMDAQEACCLGVCRTCYPVVDGVPVLINEARSVFLIDKIIAARRANLRVPERSWVGGVLPELGRSYGSEDHLRRLISLLPAGPGRRILVIGGRTRGTGTAALYATRDVEIVATDIAWGPETALVSDAHDLPFAGGSFDAVVAQALLEHVADPHRCVGEMHRVLADGGLVYAETPFMQQVHGGRHDFTRFTYLGHRRLFRSFEQISSGAVCGPGMALAWSWQYFLLSLASGPLSRRLARGIARISAFWLSRLDALLLRREAALDAASAFYFLGRRSSVPISDRELVDLYRGGAESDRGPGQWHCVQA